MIIIHAAQLDGSLALWYQGRRYLIITDDGAAEPLPASNIVEGPREPHQQGRLPHQLMGLDPTVRLLCYNRPRNPKRTKLVGEQSWLFPPGYQMRWNVTGVW